MKTKPEGFWFFRKGEFDDDKYVGDLGERIPQLYARLGYVDMRVLEDTLIVDRSAARASCRSRSRRGRSIAWAASRSPAIARFDTELLDGLYPFEGNSGPTFTQRVKGLDPP